MVGLSLAERVKGCCRERGTSVCVWHMKGVLEVLREGQPGWSREQGQGRWGTQAGPHVFLYSESYRKGIGSNIMISFAFFGG